MRLSERQSRGPAPATTPAPPGPRRLSAVGYAASHSIALPLNGSTRIVSPKSTYTSLPADHAGQLNIGGRRVASLSECDQRIRQRVRQRVRQLLIPIGPVARVAHLVEDLGVPEPEIHIRRVVRADDSRILVRNLYACGIGASAWAVDLLTTSIPRWRCNC